MKLRKPQKVMDRIAKEIVDGRRTKKVIACDVVPGGGKTLMFLIFASVLLRAGVVDQVIVLVPRKALQKQTAKAWASRSPTNPDGFRLYESRNELPLYSRDPIPLVRSTEGPVVGVIATNGQLMQMRDEYVNLAKQRSTVLFVDEFHFLAGDDANDGARWTRDVMALSEACKYVVVASGTMWRHDGEMLPLVDYGPPDSDGVRRPVVDVEYRLREAVHDCVVKQIYWQRIDANQFGFAWAPKDKRMDEFMAWMRDEMNAGARDRDERPGPGPDDDQRSERVFVPLGATIGETTYESMEGSLSPEDARLYESMCRADPSIKTGVPPEMVVRIARLHGAVEAGLAPQKTEQPASDVVTASEKMQALRERIHQTANRRDSLMGRDFGSTEKEMSQLFGPVRARNERVLLESLKWAQDRLNETIRKKDL